MIIYWNFDFTNVPIDELLILATTGGHVGEAIYGEDEEKPGWRWVAGLNNMLHKNHTPVAWMHMPKHPEDAQKEITT